MSDILEFSDFRSFLKAHFDDVKRRNPRWSIRAWAQKLDLEATASLSMVLNGKRQPGPRMVESFLRYFRFPDAKRRQYFVDLVEVQKRARDPELKVLLLEKLRRQQPKNRRRFLDAEQFAVISQWYHYALREMTRLRDFKVDPHWMQKRLAFAVPLKELERAWERLKTLGLVGEEGPVLSTSEDIADEGLKRFHEGMIDRARESVRKSRVEEREISGVTFTVEREQLPEAKKRLRSFIEEMIGAFEVEKGDATYQLNVQFFPLTKNEEKL